MHVDDMLGAGCPRSPRYKAVTDMLRATFSFREWKEDMDKPEYCGCELDRTPGPEGGRRLHQEYYISKVKPITISKRRGPHEPLDEKGITQVRGILGSMQWPAVQTSPHLLCSTSMLSGQVNKATTQTVDVQSIGC